MYNKQSYSSLCSPEACEGEAKTSLPKAKYINNMDNNTRQLKYLLDLDDRQLDILQARYSKEVISKSMSNTIRTVGKLDVHRRRTHFKECLKMYQKVREEPSHVEEKLQTIDPVVFNELKQRFEGKPWATRL